MIDKKEVIASPCVSICALDGKDLCVGCYRTGMEISGWGDMTSSEKRKVLELVKEREKVSYIG
jgi:predicted Fe-S protein YdhL (DUF1289 family)